VVLDPARVAAAVTFICRYVGGKEQVGPFISAHPEALLWRDDGACPVAEHLRLLGLRERDIRQASNAFPQLTQLASADNVDRLLRYLIDELGLTTGALGKLIATYPQLLGLSAIANVRPKIEYLEGGLGVDPRKILSRHPQLLGLSLEENIRPTVRYLREVGMAAEGKGGVGRAIEAHPALLSLSLEAKIVPTVEYLRSIGMGGTGRGEAHRSLGRVLAAQPTLLSLSIEANLEPKVAFLRSIGLDQAPGGLGAQLDAYPPLLTLSLESNLRPTADVLREAGLLDRPAALRPRHLATSLGGRLLPRLAFCEAQRESRGAVTSGLGVTLGAVTSLSDAAFAKHVGVSTDAYEIFKAQYPRQHRKPSTAALNIPWLPEGMDLSAMLYEANEAGIEERRTGKLGQSSERLGP